MKKQVKIIRENCEKSMAEEVNKHLESGWKIKGGLNVLEYSYHILLYKKVAE